MLLTQTVMSKSKMKSLKDIKAQLLKDPKVRAQYEKQQAEFAIARELIEARARAGLTGTHKLS